MLSSLQNLSRPFRTTRFYTQVAATVRAVGERHSTQPALVRYPYFVPRNTLGSLPVYTDVRNGGTRYLVLIRNVEGNATALAKDLSTSLFQQNSPEATRMKIQIIRSKHLVLSGGRWKNDVVEWLKQRGF